ncbi:MAG TPA: TRAP transporter large permease [Bacillota bacterium]|nr:TRAP transporter large permease [Bacillota bacterium]HOA15147.1 TRAP transporter large permease [Bacillota bacterium]HOG53042.1 TRAP transporter large permease [Bacillota bacterium]
MINQLLIAFGVCLILGIPIGVTIGLATIFPSLLNPSFVANTQYVIRTALAGIDSTPILAVPLFILSGAIMARGGISKKLFNMFAYFLGNKTAGIPIAVIITSLFYGAISGSGIATTAAVGSMTIPIMVSLGYDKVFAAALVATSGGLGVIIPPSIPFIIYGLVTSTSVGALFTAGIMPGILIGISLMVYAYIYCRKYGEDKEKISANYKMLKDQGFIRVFKDSFWALLTPVIILGGIYSGVVTPTEAANISVFYSLFVCVFIYKSLPLKDLPGILISSIKSYAPLTMLMGFAIAFGRVLTLMRAPQQISEFITATFQTKVTFLVALNVLLLLVGMIMDVGPVNAILAPMFMGVISRFGIDPVHFGIIMTVNLAIGFVTPPFGVNLFVAAPLVGSPVFAVGKKAYPFIVAFIIALTLITFIPEISLFLGRR